MVEHAGEESRSAAATRVKICGVTSVDDAQFAADAGAWAIGLIFAPSVRACAPEEAAAIGSLLQRRVEVAGVFVNAHLDEVAERADSCGLTLVQLHGDEGPAYCAEVGRRTGCKVIKAMRVKDVSSIRALGAYSVDYHLLDAHVPGRRGGTGTTFAWDVASHHPRRTPVILSGGIVPDNAADAIAAVRPFAIDSASGTEAAPGRKDPAKVRALIRAAGAERVVA